MSGNKVTGESAWAGSGGGPSAYEPRPSYQDSIASIVGAHRGNPDIAAVADPATGVAIYSFATSGWTTVGGTSVATPVSAGIANNTGLFLNSTFAQNTYFYSKAGTRFIRDIVAGRSGPYSSRAGWDFVTGIGAFIEVPDNTPILPSGGQFEATPGTTATYPFVAVSPATPPAAITGTRLKGPSWISYDGATLTVSPPANTPQGNYPATLEVTDNEVPPLSATVSIFVYVTNPTLSGCTFASKMVQGGSSAILNLTLSSPAPSGGAVISLGALAGLLSPPATYTIPAGQSSAAISVPTAVVSKLTLATLTATFGKNAITTTVRLLPQPSN